MESRGGLGQVRLGPGGRARRRNGLVRFGVAGRVGYGAFRYSRLWFGRIIKKGDFMKLKKIDIVETLKEIEKKAKDKKAFFELKEK